eukprot:3877456-Alexandrium_andersonii.AAC.1
MPSGCPTLQAPVRNHPRELWGRGGGEETPCTMNGNAADGLADGGWRLADSGGGGGGGGGAAAAAAAAGIPVAATR